MKKAILILFTISSLLIASCSSSDDNSGADDFPQVVNIKFEVTTTRNTDAIINRTLNNDTEADAVFSLPYSFTYAQQEVNQGAYLKLTYQDNGVYFVDQNGSNWTDYETELVMLIDNQVVKSEAFTITEGMGSVQIDYTFE